MIHTLIGKTLIHTSIGVWFKTFIPLFNAVHLTKLLKMSKHTSELLDGYVYIILVEMKCISSKFYPHNG